MMQYKGYSATILFDDENNIFHGEVLGIRDVVTFQGSSVKDLRKAFAESVDDYIQFCTERGELPDKPVSGRFVLRISPELHRKLYKAASKSGQSLNAWITSQLENEVGGTSMQNPTRKRSIRAKKKSTGLQRTLAGKK
jgi:predicted HicB family RNase H-like nuclease